LSLGLPLAGYPLVNAAIAILGFALAPLALPNLGCLLRSPFIAGAGEEGQGRALFEAFLRKKGEIEISNAKLESLISYWNSNEQAGATRCVELSRHLGEFRKAASQLPSSALASQWTVLFSELLEMIGWPGVRSPDSRQYQLLEAWRHLLEQAGQLDTVEQRITGRAALARLRKMAADTIFQPERKDAPVQILGVMEAAGLQFDRVWIMGFGDEAWPHGASPNPFIPLRVQRERKLPHSSADRELEFSQMLTRRLCAISGKAVLSYPLQEGDRSLSPSPLISKVPEIDESSLRLATLKNYRQTVYDSGRAETFTDPMTVPAGEGQSLHGGSRLIERQAACPFSAFAEFRLGAKKLESAAAWIDSRDKGTLLHEAMERLWRELGSSQRLHSLADEELDDLADRSVESAIQTLANRKPDSFQPEFQRLEKERLKRLLAEWLLIEKKRSPFWVETSEEERPAEIGGIKLKLKADRIDRLEDGRQALIDYKTGDVTVSAWNGERPDSPQLPLYCITRDDGKKVAGIAFAQLKHGKTKFVGVASEEGIFPNVTPQKDPPWETRLAQWREAITHLCEEIALGRAAVNPKKPPLTCTYCRLQPLCRIHEGPPTDEDVGRNSEEDAQ
jgi:ATP-dependent helicase/nuclease subunit B